MEVLVNDLSHISGKHTKVPGHNGCPDVPSRLHEALTSGREVGGILSLNVWVIVHYHKAAGRKDQSGHLQASQYNEIPIHFPHVEVSQDLLEDLFCFVLVDTGGCVFVPATCPTGQLAYSTGTSCDDIEVLSHAKRLGIQRVAGVAQQVHDASVRHVHLLWFKIFFFVGEEGSEIDNGQRHQWRKPSSPALCNEIALLTSIATVLHGKLQNALHENGTVPKAGTVHRPEINVVGVGTHDNISEHLIQGESQIRVMIQ